jgi:HSP20 family protein
MIDTASRQDLEELTRQLERAMDQLVHRHFSHFRTTETWTPAINAYRLAGRIEVCVDLAGVDRESIHIRAEPGLLVIRGFRHAPHPQHRGGENVQILAMEIDHGPFERTFQLPRQVVVDKIKAEQRNGLLWIKLPIGHG